MENNYKIQTGTFKSLKHFSENGMLRGQNDFNDDFYDIFAGETCEFAVFEDGEVFQKDTKVQVNPEDIDFGCCHCNGGFQINKSSAEPTVTISSDRLHIIGLGNSVTINYCPMCGRKLKIDE